MKRIFVLFCFLFSSMASALDLMTIYDENLRGKETGAYEQSGYLFFVINQPCLTDKKYSGTKESKLAEKEFYALLSKTAKRYNLSFDKGSIEFGGELQSAIYDNISMNYNALSTITHQLVIDRDNKSCTRVYVQASALDNFGKNKVKLSAEQVLNVAVELLFSAVREDDYLLASKYLAEFDLPRLVAIYQTKLEENSYPFNLAYGDIYQPTYKCKDKKYCTPPPTPFNKYDINSVIATVLKEKGLLKIEAANPSIDLSNDYFAMAKREFDLGINPENIVENLILSINFNNQNSNAWKLLSSIDRALHRNEEALMAATQYAIQSNEKIESWVYLLKTLQPVAPEEAKRLQKLLVLMTNKTKLTSWAKSQIKDYQ